MISHFKSFLSSFLLRTKLTAECFSSLGRCKRINKETELLSVGVKAIHVSWSDY